MRRFYHVSSMRSFWSFSNTVILYIFLVAKIDQYLGQAHQGAGRDCHEVGRGRILQREKRGKGDKTVNLNSVSFLQRRTHMLIIDHLLWVSALQYPFKVHVQL